MKPLAPLLEAQAAAADPDRHAWVAASAGTGKTQLLTARVLRLLLAGVPAPAILCITFTRLAAAEMQARVVERLAFWARADEAALAADLASLGEPADAAGRLRARRLFARLLDSPQGLGVQTIHALAQSLIASFPLEAGVAPGFRALDDRAAAELKRQLLIDAIEAADQPFIDDVALLSLNGGEASLQRLLGQLGRLGPLPAGPVEPTLRRALGLPTDASAEADLATSLAGFDRDGVVRLVAAWAEAGNANSLRQVDALEPWLADRSDWPALARGFLTAAGKPRNSKVVPAEAERAQPGLKALFDRLAAEVDGIATRQRQFAAIDRAAAWTRVARRLAADWAAAKAREGVIDYDDMIEAARRLLASEGAAHWVRFKLDARIDHLLVDEAQDTNDPQWDIVHALADEFFAGAGARDVARRLFVVGDYKQSIFSFQGADPRIYRDRRETFAQLAGDAGSPMVERPLSTNFRSAPAILEVVDAVADALAARGEPLDPDGVPAHLAHHAGRAGAVRLLPPTEPEHEEEDGEEAETGAPDDSEEDGRRPGRTEIAHARALAGLIAGWLDPAHPLILPHTGLPVAPQDILVLVRRRTPFSAALVAALHQAGVPVAGVDRLKLADPLAVADLMAAVRFAVQPEDDLTLASLLVSPLVGLSHDALHALAFGRPGSLWQAVRASADPAVAEARTWLEAVLGFADLAGPYQFLETLLSVPFANGWLGRQRLLARLGEDARDPIETLLDQALAYQQTEVATLQGFLAWIEAGDIEVKRDPDAPLDAVRLMTVHGAKGLQAPVVLLADTTHQPNLARQAPLLLPADGTLLPFEPGPAKGLGPRVERALADLKADMVSEHWRLLYVALTRAESLLLLAGIRHKPPRDKPDRSWHALVEAAMAGLGATRVHDPHLGADVLVHAGGRAAPPPPVILRPEPARSELPDWARTPAPPETRPMRLTSPSALVADTLAEPPAATLDAARRGAVMHLLFERLPAVAPERRAQLAESLVRSRLPGIDPAPLVAEALAVLAEPELAPLFGPEALAEAPVAARLGDTLIAGQLDRLWLGEGRVRFVDFKTSRRVPASAEAAPAAHLAQMAGYAAALAQVFPGAAIEAMLLYTAGPRLLMLPPALLAAHAPEVVRPYLNHALRNDTDTPILSPT